MFCIDFNMNIFAEKLESSGWEYVQSGRHRATFRRGNVVIKVPSGKGGTRANEAESILYRKYRNSPDPVTGVVYAPCRLLSNGALMMRAVTIYTYRHDAEWDTLPSWRDQLLDGYQFGKDKNGTYKAYDYSCQLENL